MQGYSALMSALPRRWGSYDRPGRDGRRDDPFWFFFQSEAVVGAGGVLLLRADVGVLLISQFWTLANIVYDPRQAKRMFGFIGGGAPLGGIAASALLSAYTTQIGTVNFLLISAALLLLCAFIVDLDRPARETGRGSCGKAGSRRQGLRKA